MTRSDIDSLRTAGMACVAGALITAIGGIVTQILRASSTVPDDAWSFPYSGTTFVAVSLLWALSHALLFVGLLGLRRSGLAGATRAARTGLALAMVGTALLIVAEFASLPIANATEGESGPAIVGSLFGLATLLSAIGLLVAGRATLQAKRWRGWRRYTPLVCGLGAAGLIAITFTSALSLGVAVYGLCFLGLGVALFTEPSPATRAATSPQLQGS